MEEEKEDNDSTDEESELSEEYSDVECLEESDRE